jgi:hypothetical protein
MTSPHSLATAVAQRHPCGATNCDTSVPADTFTCEPHTNMLAPPLRHGVRDSYESGQAVIANPYLSAAIDAVRHKEKRTKPAHDPRKAIHLALFDI